MAISSTSSGLRAGVCTSTTRPTTPYDGQVIYETDTDRTLVWNNSAWVFLSTSTANPVGLELIKTQTIGTAQSSVPVSNAFSSAYANYRIMMYGGASQGTQGALRVSLGNGSVSGHYTIMTYQAYGSNTVQGTYRDNQTYFEWAGLGTSSGYQMCFELRNPQLPTFTHATSFFSDSTNTGTAHHRFAGTTQFTDFTISGDANAGTLTGGVIAVYGYKN